MQNSFTLKWPRWARLSHPVTRYIWQKTAFHGPRWLYVVAVILSLLMLASLIYVTDRMYTAGELDGLLVGKERGIYIVLYPFLMLIQVAVTFGVVAQAMLIHLTAPNAALEDRQRTWELAKATSHGAELVTWSRWAVLIWRMGSAVMLIFVVRVLFVGLIAFDWVRDLDSWHAAVQVAQPGVPGAVAVLLIGLLLAGLVALPVISVAFSVSVGVLLSATLYRRWVIGLLQRVIVIIGMLAVMVCLLAGWSVIKTPHGFKVDWPAEFAALFSMVLAGDMGLRLLSPPVLLEVIAQVEYGIWLGLPVMGLVILQALLARWLMLWAVRIAARPTQE